MAQPWPNDGFRVYPHRFPTREEVMEDFEALLFQAMVDRELDRIRLERAEAAIEALLAQVQEDILSGGPLGYAPEATSPVFVVIRGV